MTFLLLYRETDYYRMEDQNTLVFITVLLVLGEFVNTIVHAKIYSHQLEDKDEYFSVLDWKPREDVNLHRFKRNIFNGNRHRRENPNGKMYNETNTLKSSTFHIPDESHSQAVVSWSGRNSSVVFLLTRDKTLYGLVENSTLWRSADYGTSFTRVNFSSKSVAEFIYKSPVNRNKIILTDQINQCLYISEDEGKSWITSHIGFEPEKVYMHPTKEDWVLGYSFMDYMLYVSSDLGRTWKMLKADVAVQIYWAVEGEDDNPLTVHMEVQDVMMEMESEYISCIAPDCVDNTPDRSVGAIDFASLKVHNQYIFVQKHSSHELYVSYKRGPFMKAYFPLNVHPKDFDIVETSDNQVFLAADHQENMVTLYLSDVTGQFYVPSLERVVADADIGYLDVDIYKVKGINGRYIANQYRTGNGKDSSTVMKTFISYDKGGNWVPIEAPEDQKASCDDPNSCNLHLHLAYSSIFYGTPVMETEEEAPGLILAHGSVGDSLDPNQVQLYVSRDGGLSWTKPPLEGQFMLNILDHGGAITAIQDNQERTNIVHFSCDEGATWRKHKFSDEEIFADGVLNSPGITTLVVSVFGRLSGDRGRLMVKLDFSPVLTRQCIATDYINWSPGSNISQHNCIMGQDVTYERRSQFSKCFNGPHYVRRRPTSICLCRDADFECDYGYERTVNGQCLPQAWYNHSYIEWHCKEGEMYDKTQGYRLIASDKCTGGLSTSDLYRPVSTVCPITPPRGLMLSIRKTTIALGTNTIFTLTQKSGSVLGTMYTWTFGDTDHTVVDTGLTNTTKKHHQFSRPGFFNVTVVARNSKGSAICQVTISVEANITAILALAPWGAEVGRLTQINVTLCCRGNQSDFGFTHYVWKFGDEPKGAQPYLTWGTTVSHRYNRTGQYNVTVQAVNSVSSVLTTYPVRVYDNITIVRLRFTPNLDHYSSGSFDWRYTTSQIICMKLAEMLYVQSNRLMVSIPQIHPTIADVTILPSQKGALTVEQVVLELRQKVKSRQIRFQMITLVDAIGIIGVEIIKGNISSLISTSAPIVEISTPPHVAAHIVTVKKSESVPVAVYIVVPLILVIVGGLVAVIIVCVKRKHKENARYSLIMNRQQGETIMEVEDDDDDEFLGGGENIYESSDGDNSIIIHSVHNPTLVMMTGTHGRPTNSADC